ncbi:helix-turn-helix domain-containing protein [Clostridium coskatii]|uniref:Helix-turn-helix domain protein n=1 Tax=Clostridium coskatii TaxID=1705578 RepID=A0A166T106_9CLOT|nr:helix-turn-helix transcriptional regulator [Clostridium coskatii]OAA93038.1 Helix-turn-helix domain protein [Clostridium coskatii]OBR90781.1 helix-turn-helix domain protein [Clostridium coskatii]
MKFYEDEILEKIGYDFYCDIAINIVNKRKELGLTQEELSKKTAIKLSRLRKIENVQYRIKLDEIEHLAKALDVTVNNLINSEIESQAGDCLYLVYVENCENFQLYSRASNKRMAFLKLEKKLNDEGHTWFSTPRTRVFVKLVGVPVVKQELEDKLPRFKEDQEVEK